MKEDHNLIEYRISLKSQFSNKLYGYDIEMIIPVPPNTGKHHSQTSHGKIKYVAEENVFKWK